MGWEDRPHYHENRGYSANPIVRFLNGSVPLFTVFGIRVRAHASLVILIVATIIWDSHKQYPMGLRAVSMGLLALSVILHEFGHCFAARRVGGSADDVLLWPLGGLATAEAPRKPLPTFLTVLAGPLVSLSLALISAAVVYAFTPTQLMRSFDPHATRVLVSLNPVHMFYQVPWSYTDPVAYFEWLYGINLLLFVFNLLPIYPMDGGQMLQAFLWAQIGHFRSMLVATTVGMIGSVTAGVVALGLGLWFLAFLFVWTFINSYQARMLLRESAPEDWQESVDFNASIYGRGMPPPPKRRRLSRRVVKKARRIAQREKAERDQIDMILAKVSATGMNSLSWLERRTLRKTSERQRKRELEFSRFQ